MKILYQGSPGAYSHLAALEINPNAEVIPCKTFDECFIKAEEDNKARIIEVKKKQAPKNAVNFVIKFAVPLAVMKPPPAPPLDPPIPNPPPSLF